MKQARRRLQRVGIGIGCLLLIYQICQGIRGVQGNELLVLSPLFLLPALVLVVLSFAQQMASWRILMQGLGVTIPWKPLFQGYLLSFLPRYIPGTVWGYLSRSEWLFQDYQVSYTLTHMGSLLEIVIALLSNAIVGGIYFFLLTETPSPIGIMLALVLLLIVPWITFQRILRWPRIARWVLKEAPQGSTLRFPLPNWIASLALITFNMLLYGIALYFAYHAFNFPFVPFSLSNLLRFGAIFSAAWVSGFIVFFLPSGLGVREVTLSSLLTLNFGLSFEQASGLAVLFRLIITVVEFSCIGMSASFQWFNQRPVAETKRREKM